MPPKQKPGKSKQDVGTPPKFLVAEHAGEVIQLPLGDERSQDKGDPSSIVGSIQGNLADDDCPF